VGSPMDPLPQNEGLITIKQLLNRAPDAVRAVIPDPRVGFTLFVPSDAALNASATGAYACMPFMRSAALDS
jgi:hypothetical protein